MKFLQTLRSFFIPPSETYSSKGKVLLASSTVLQKSSATRSLDCGNIIRTASWEHLFSDRNNNQVYFQDILSSRGTCETLPGQDLFNKPFFFNQSFYSCGNQIQLVLKLSWFVTSWTWKGRLGSGKVEFAVYKRFYLYFVLFIELPRMSKIKK